jgi:hypothetical protein
MNSPEPFHSPALLEWWLDAATAKLAAPARERIRGEITAHFTDAVERHLRDGCTETEAREAAVSELGDPQLAAIRFRRSHLTVKEAKRVEALAKNFRHVWSRLYWIGVPFLMLLALILLEKDQHIRYLLRSSQLAFIAAAYSVALFVAGIRWGWADSRLLSLVSSMEALSSMVFWTVLSSRWLLDSTWDCFGLSALVAIVVPHGVRLTYAARLWWKLIRIGNIQDEVTPNAGVAS